MPIFSDIEEGLAENESLKMKRAMYNIVYYTEKKFSVKNYRTKKKLK
jgi:hypothetical protein